MFLAKTTPEEAEATLVEVAEDAEEDVLAVAVGLDEVADADAVDDAVVVEDDAFGADAVVDEDVNDPNICSYQSIKEKELVELLFEVVLADEVALLEVVVWEDVLLFVDEFVDDDVDPKRLFNHAFTSKEP